MWGKEDKTHLSLAPRGSGGVTLREAAFNLKNDLQYCLILPFIWTNIETNIGQKQPMWKVIFDMDEYLWTLFHPVEITESDIFL